MDHPVTIDVCKNIGPRWKRKKKHIQQQDEERTIPDIFLRNHRHRKTNSIGLKKFQLNPMLSVFGSKKIFVYSQVVFDICNKRWDHLLLLPTVDLTGISMNKIKLMNR